MPIYAMLLSSAPVLASPVPGCRPAQLRLSLDGRDGGSAGMSHSGTMLRLRNIGRECSLPGLPTVTFLDVRGRVLPAVRRAPVGMHPGPVVVPVRLPGGHHADIALRWVSGPVFARDRGLAASSVAVRIGGSTLRTPLKAMLHGAAGEAVLFDQAPLRSAEGMAADLP